MDESADTQMLVDEEGAFVVKVHEDPNSDFIEVSFAITTDAHDWGLALANLEEAHEDLCQLQIRTWFVALDEPLARMRTAIYLLTGS